MPGARPCHTLPGHQLPGTVVVASGTLSPILHPCKNNAVYMCVVWGGTASSREWPGPLLTLLLGSLNASLSKQDELSP